MRWVARIAAMARPKTTAGRVHNRRGGVFASGVTGEYYHRAEGA